MHVSCSSLFYFQHLVLEKFNFTYREKKKVFFLIIDYLSSAKTVLKCQNWQAQQICPWYWGGAGMQN